MPRPGHRPRAVSSSCVGEGVAEVLLLGRFKRPGVGAPSPLAVPRANRGLGSDQDSLSAGKTREVFTCLSTSSKPRPGPRASWPLRPWSPWRFLILGPAVSVARANGDGRRRLVSTSRHNFVVGKAYTETNNPGGNAIIVFQPPRRRQPESRPEGRPDGAVKRAPSGRIRAATPCPFLDTPGRGDRHRERAAWWFAVKRGQQHDQLVPPDGRSGLKLVDQEAVRWRLPEQPHRARQPAVRCSIRTRTASAGPPLSRSRAT